ncbi:MAG TPA: glycosyltransferase family 1 protein [Terriglobia bacterium]|nr:glycosyltransferase family 1 protein [Terriglobia bacterium]
MFTARTKRGKASSMGPVVSLDARTLGATGLGTYTGELLENFASLDHHEFRFRVLCTKPELMEKFPLEKFEFVPTAAPIYSIKEQWEVMRTARGGDLLHCTHYNIPYFHTGRMVVTIHDLTHLTHPEFLPNRLAYYYARFMLSAAAQRARQVITVSQFSKQSICEILGVPEEKVHVIPFGLPRRSAESKPLDGIQLEKLGIVRPYVLFVGLLKPHKNVQALLRAFACLPEQIRCSHRLVIAGKLGSYYPTLSRVSAELQLQDRVQFTGQVSDEELHALYAGAKAFVLPSLNEGFGLPALEAMSYGLPVIVSNTSSLPEVVGNAGMLVDPTDDRSIALAIEAVLADSDLRRKLSALSRERAKAFSAKEFARQHLEVYREALRN